MTEDDLIVRVRIAFRPIRSAQLPEPTGPRGTEAHPYVKCLYRAEDWATDMHLMTGPVTLEPFVLYEADAIFLNPGFARGRVTVGQRFEVFGRPDPLGRGEVVRSRSDLTLGVVPVGDGLDRFPAWTG